MPNSMPDWKQLELRKKLKVGLYEILEVVMGYVDRSWDVQVDQAVEQELQDIENTIEDLAIRIENGQYRKEEDYA